MAEISKIDHVALIVDDMDAAGKFWGEYLQLPLEGREVLPEHGVETTFYSLGESTIELVKPLDNESGAARFLAKRGPGLHHISIEVVELEGMLAQLRKAGVQLINETPVVGAGGKLTAFIHPSSANGVLVELCERVD